MNSHTRTCKIYICMHKQSYMLNMHDLCLTLSADAYYAKYVHNSESFWCLTINCRCFSCWYTQTSFLKEYNLPRTNCHCLAHNDYISFHKHSSVFLENTTIWLKIYKRIRIKQICSWKALLAKLERKMQNACG